MNYIIKNFSKILALILFFNTSTPYFQAINTDNAKNKENKIFTTIKNKGKEFYENHPFIFDVSKLAFGVSCLYGTYKTIYELGKIWYLKDITTAIDNLSNQKVKEKLQEEISKYEQRAPEIFKIEESLIKKSHPRTLLLTLMRLNYLFDKYDKFTNALISYKRQQGTDFTLRLLNFKDDRALTIILEERTECDLGGFAFGNLSDYRDNLFKYKRCHKIEHFAPCDNDKLIEYIITHEFGHAIQYLYITKKHGIDWKNTAKIRCLGGIDNIEKEARNNKKFFYVISKIESECNSIKKGILNRAKGIYSSSNTIISKYGKVSTSEFFAEAFAHMECSSSINPIGLATRDIISAWFSD